MFENRSELIVNGINVEVFKIKKDINGNPRYIISQKYLSENKNEALSLIKEIGGKTYKEDKINENYYVFQSHNVRNSIEILLNKKIERENLSSKIELDR